MKNIKIGGVPEHFNLPWHLCVEDGSFRAKNIEVNWKDFPGGTGAMCKALRAKEIDVAIILTEGIVKDIVEGNPSKIIQTFIASPLLWGIHVAKNSEYTNVHQLKNKKAAISRIGSGSHLMAYVHAQNLNWDTNNLQFEIVKNLDGAVAALTEDTAQYFMWEKFTTKPLVDKGIFRNIGNCPTPWPCFVIAVREDFFNAEENAIKTLLEVINQKTKHFKQIPNIEETLANRYGQKKEDIEQWLSMTEWSQEQVSAKTIQLVQQNLLQLKLIDEDIAPTEFLLP